MSRAFIHLTKNNSARNIYYWSETYVIDPSSFVVVRRRKFRSQTSDNTDRWKAEQGSGREKKKIRREKIRRERVRKKKMQTREKVGKSRFAMFFQWFVAKEAPKVSSLKRRVRSQLARWEMKNCRPLWREAHVQVKTYKTHHRRTTFGRGDKAHLEVKMCKAPQCRTTFGSWDVEKVHAVVALQSKCSKHWGVGPLLEVHSSKKCTLLWREAHFEVKMYKAPRARATFGGWDVEKVHAVVARSTFRSQNVLSTRGSDRFCRFRGRKSARRCSAKRISKSKCSKHEGFGPLLEVQMSKKCMPLWRKAHFEVNMFKTLGARTSFGSSDVASLHYTTLHDTTLHSTTLHYRILHITPHYTPVRYITLHYTTLQCAPVH